MMEAILSFEISVLTRATCHSILEDNILQGKSTLNIILLFQAACQNFGALGCNNFNINECYVTFEAFTALTMKNFVYF
jgi:hypothetical protein